MEIEQEKRKKIKTIVGFLIMGMLLSCGVAFYFVYLKIIVPNQLEKSLKENGIKTIGILIKSEETGFFVGDSQPEMRITLKIASKNGETWEAETDRVISLSQLYLLAPGTIFNVIYDPKDKSKIIISD